MIMTKIIPQNPRNIYLNKVMNAPSDYGKPWFGQLMALPQMYAYLIEINAWLKEYKVKIHLS